MNRPSMVWATLLAGAVLTLGGCASPKPAPSLPLQAAPVAEATTPALWEGRLSVNVYTKPPQRFAANFVLQGSAQAGDLVLSSPLGTIWARMEWHDGAATLEAEGKQYRFASLQDLTLRVTGAELPVAPLFEWLQGRPAQADGWEADLRALPQGRLEALHIEEVRTELLVLLDR